MSGILLFIQDMTLYLPTLMDYPKFNPIKFEIVIWDKDIIALFGENSKLILFSWGYAWRSRALNLHTWTD